jgi:dienelactone hydrolase
MRLSLARFVVFLSCSAAFTQTPFHFTAKPGPFPVGLNVVEQYDYSRVYRPAMDDLGKPYVGERARPLQTLIWYPAQSTSRSPMTVADYGQLAATETSFGKPHMSQDDKDWIAGMTPTLKDAMWARRDAPEATGSFPLVVYAPSFSAASWENADLCEYLASNGYVVIASPDMGATARGMTSDLAGIDAQAEDITFLISYARTLPNIDMSQIAVAGFSWGGISNLFAAAHDSRIRALVALDGSMRYYPGLIEKAGDVHPEAMTIPLLYFSQGEIPLENIELHHARPDQTGPSPLNAWTHGDLVSVHDLALVHTEHSSMYQRNEEAWKEYAEDHKADYVREDGIAGYAWVCRYTLSFLDAYLKHDASALAWLKKTPAENGVPAHFLTVKFRAASGTPASLDGFRAEIGRQGFDHAPEIYAAMKKEKADFKIDEDVVADWADRLMDQNHSPEAITLLKFNVQNYPDSSGAYAHLAEIYSKSGDKPLARENYQKAIEKDPNNADAKNKLKALDAGTGAPK